MTGGALAKTWAIANEAGGPCRTGTNPVHRDNGPLSGLGAATFAIPIFFGIYGGVSVATFFHLPMQMSAGTSGPDRGSAR
ncbi:MAG: hypothetical protein NVSMB62_18110 [Acidobacteriaceae bacterium]